MLETAVSTIAFLVMIVGWATVEPVRARMSRTITTAKSQALHTQSA
jgi:hypothetical protein